MAKIERKVRFSAPVSEVFAYIADFQTLEEYNPSLGQVRSLTPGSPGEGSRYELTLSMLGVKFRALLTIAEFKENELIVTHLDAFIPAKEWRVFSPAGEETDFLFIIEFKSEWPLIGTWLDNFLVKLFAVPQADLEIKHLKKRFDR